jgi:hypothetical protein
MTDILAKAVMAVTSIMEAAPTNALTATVRCSVSALKVEKFMSGNVLPWSSVMPYILHKDTGQSKTLPDMNLFTSRIFVGVGLERVPRYR